jgi:Na+/H+-dicarboxylate symporter
VIGNGIAAAVVAKWEGELLDPASVEQDVAMAPLR